jgi:hypothetical protein
MNNNEIRTGAQFLQDAVRAHRQRGRPIGPQVIGMGLPQAPGARSPHSSHLTQGVSGTAVPKPKQTKASCPHLESVFSRALPLARWQLARTASEALRNARRAAEEYAMYEALELQRLKERVAARVEASFVGPLIRRWGERCGSCLRWLRSGLFLETEDKQHAAGAIETERSLSREHRIRI